MAATCTGRTLFSKRVWIPRSDEFKYQECWFSARIDPLCRFSLTQQFVQIDDMLQIVKSGNVDQRQAEMRVKSKRQSTCDDIPFQIGQFVAAAGHPKAPKSKGSLESLSSSEGKPVYEFTA